MCTRMIRVRRIKKTDSVSTRPEVLEEKGMVRVKNGMRQVKKGLYKNCNEMEGLGVVLNGEGIRRTEKKKIGNQNTKKKEIRI